MPDPENMKQDVVPWCSFMRRYREYTIPEASGTRTTRSTSGSAS
jgi:hypothetical protein